MRYSAILHEPSQSQLSWGQFLSQVIMKLVKNSDITLTFDGNGMPIFFEPVRSQQTVLGIEGHKCSDL